MKRITRREPLPTEFRYDIGRADGGRSFIRITHVPTGIHRIHVGLTGVNQHALIRKLYQEVLGELAQNHPKDS